MKNIEINCESNKNYLKTTLNTLDFNNSLYFNYSVLHYLYTFKVIEIFGNNCKLIIDDIKKTHPNIKFPEAKMYYLDFVNN